jgi:hypothetical protein
MKKVLLGDITDREVVYVASLRQFLANAMVEGFDQRAFRRLLRTVATPEAIQLWLEGQQVLSMAVQERALALGLTASAEKSPKLVDVARRVAENVLDRTRGRPTERVAVASRIRIEFGGLDPTLLPSQGGTVPPPGTRAISRTRTTAHEVVSSGSAVGETSQNAPGPSEVTPVASGNDQDRGG